jgi:hypothetical protein
MFDNVPTTRVIPIMLSLGLKLKNPIQSQNILRCQTFLYWGIS